MLLHTVYFWLKPGLAAADIARFERDIQAMGSIPGIVHFWVGKPAPTHRPVIDSSYSYSLVVAFEDLAAHDGYQAHPVHDVFRENASMWSEVKIYDSTALPTS